MSAFLYFFPVCSDHFYGTNCDTPCGHCINNDVCDNATGHCPNGCYNFWTGKKCDGNFKENLYVKS